MHYSRPQTSLFFCYFQSWGIWILWERQPITAALTDLSLPTAQVEVIRHYSDKDSLQQTSRTPAFSYFQRWGIWTLSEMQTITAALTNLQWFTVNSEVSRNYGNKEVFAPDLTAFTSSLLQIFAQTREVILGSGRVGEVASRPGSGLTGSNWWLWINSASWHRLYSELWPRQGKSSWVLVDSVR